MQCTRRQQSGVNFDGYCQGLERLPGSGAWGRSGVELRRPQSHRPAIVGRSSGNTCKEQCDGAACRFELPLGFLKNKFAPRIEFVDTAMPTSPHSVKSGCAVLAESVPISPTALRLVSARIHTLWERIVSADPDADVCFLLLS
jgi:hypothetical protein